MENLRVKAGAGVGAAQFRGTVLPTLFLGNRFPDSVKLRVAGDAKASVMDYQRSAVSTTAA